MNRISLLTLALVAILPGCGGSKNKPAKQSKQSNNVAKYMDYESDIVEENDGDEEEDGNDEYENAVEFDFDGEDEDGNDEDVSLSDLDYEEMPEEYQEDIEEGTEEAFRWIDAQTDDEFKALYFTFNHYGVRADQKESINYDIEQVKQLLAESGTTAQPTVVVEGHTCQEGDPAYNVPLSEKRAKTVADYLVAAGIDRNIIKVVGRGSECPAVVKGKAVNGSREDRWPNRRVEIRVIYT